MYKVFYSLTDPAFQVLAKKLSDGSYLVRNPSGETVWYPKECFEVSFIDRAPNKWGPF